MHPRPALPPAAGNHRPAGRARLLTTLGCVCAGLLIPAAAQARNPRLERLQPDATDQATAAAAILTTSDLAAGWTSLPNPLATLTPPHCPGVTVDLSHFTLTGQAETVLAAPNRLLLTRIQVYPSPHSARSDFTTTSNAANRCNPYTLTHQLQLAAPHAIVTLLSRHRRLGAHTTRDQITIQTRTPSREQRIYLDALDTLYGRYTITLIYLGTTPEPIHPATLTTTIVNRLSHTPPAI